MQPQIARLVFEQFFDPVVAQDREYKSWQLIKYLIWSIYFQNPYQILCD